MKFSFLKALALSTVSVFALTAERVGPVSQYGQLLAGKNSAGKGQIYGSCKGVQDGAEVQVKGMSLYWSLKPEAVDFWNLDGVTSMVNNMNIQIVRASMATGSEDWWGCKTPNCGDDPSTHYRCYALDPTTQTNLVNAVVEAAIKNDIYVIIDWHSHEAQNQTESAKKFFAEMAQKWGAYDNVIFEIYNEPTDISWSEVKTYANAVIPVIREHSDNLILVGNPKWDQNPQMAINNEVTDPKNNTAYTLHYYANSHCYTGSYDWGGACEGTNGLEAMNAGLYLFVSEWGTGNADGGGTPNISKNTGWQNYMDTHKLSWANWSASRISEGTAAFTESSTANNLQYTTSGQLVLSYLQNNPTTYTACSGNVNPPEPPESIKPQNLAKQIVVQKTANEILYTIPTNGFTTIEMFDLLGNKKYSEKANKIPGTHSISLNTFAEGTYIFLVRQKSAVTKTKISIVRN